MKRNFKWFFIFTIAIGIFLCLPTFVHAQDPLPCVGPDPLDGECPIDSGLIVLLAVGAGYGIKKVVDSRKARVINTQEL